MVKWTMPFFLFLIEKPKLLSYLLNGLKLKLFENENHTHTHATYDFWMHCFFKCHLTVCNSPNIQTCWKQKRLSHARAFFVPVRIHSKSVSLDAFQSWKQMKANFLAIQHSVTMICYKRERDLVIVAHSCRQTVRTIYRRFLGPCRLLCMPANNCYFSRVYFVSIQYEKLDFENPKGNSWTMNDALQIGHTFWLLFETRECE